MIKHCYSIEKVKRIVLGSGGSAFVDGGFGAFIHGMKLFSILQTDASQPILKLMPTDVSYLTLN